MRVNPPILVRHIPGHFKRYSRCRGLVRRIQLLEQTRFGCYELKSKNRTKTVLINRLFFKNISVVPTSKTSLQIVSEFTIKRLFFHLFSLQFQLPKHRFKERQNEPFSRPCFHYFFSSSNFKHIVSNILRMHNISSLVSKFA